MEGVVASSDGGMTLSTLKLERGYYRTSIESGEILQCHREEACVGGVEPSGYCGTGYRGACEFKSPGVLHDYYKVLDNALPDAQGQLSKYAAHTSP